MGERLTDVVLFRIPLKEAKNSASSSYWESKRERAASPEVRKAVDSLIKGPPESKDPAPEHRK
jgi:hypothetical protein